MVDLLRVPKYLMPFGFMKYKYPSTSIGSAQVPRAVHSCGRRVFRCFPGFEGIARANASNCYRRKFL